MHPGKSADSRRWERTPSGREPATIMIVIIILDNARCLVSVSANCYNSKPIIRQQLISHWTSHGEVDGPHIKFVESKFNK